MRTTALCVFVCAALAGAEAEQTGLPIDSSSIPGLFTLMPGSAPSLLVQVGDGRMSFSTSMLLPPPIQANSQLLLPLVDPLGRFYTPETDFDIGDVHVHFDVPPSGQFLISSGKVNMTLGGHATLTWLLNDGSTYQTALDITFTTGTVTANADGPDTLLMFGNTSITGVPFDCTSGDGIIVTAFTVPRNLPQETVDQITAALGDAGIPLNGSYFLGAPIGVKFQCKLTEAYVITPVITPNGGRFKSYVSVSIETLTSDAEIHYTTDGSVPTIGSPRYYWPVFMWSDDFTITARAFLPGFSDSDIVSASFVKMWKTPGDVNRDCAVNIIDLIAVRNKLNADPLSGNNWQMDVNEDGKINILDLIMVRNLLNTKCP